MSLALMTNQDGALQSVEMPELTSLVDSLYELERAKKLLEDKIVAAKNKLACEMKALDLKEIIGSFGQRYTTFHTPGDRTYGPEVLALLTAKGTMPEFTKVKITETGLSKLYKAGTLSDNDIAYIQAHTDYEKGSLTVRQFQSKEEEGGSECP